MTENRRKKQKLDDAMLMALTCGATIEEAAAKAGLSRRTATRRMHDPAFQDRLRDLRIEMAKRASSMLTAAGMSSVRTLLHLQENVYPPAVRLGAARAALEIGLRIRETVEMEERLANLERTLKTETPPPHRYGIHASATPC